LPWFTGVKIEQTAEEALATRQPNVSGNRQQEFESSLVKMAVICQRLNNLFVGHHDEG
jgi:hypothetical protein